MEDALRDLARETFSRGDIEKIASRSRWLSVALAGLSLVASMVTGGAVAGWTAGALIGGIQTNISRLDEKEKDLTVAMNVQRDVASSVTAAIAGLRAEIDDLKGSLERERQDRLEEERRRLGRGDK